MTFAATAPSKTTNVLTLRLDAESHTHFDQLRRRHFPPERNLIAAHVTLFHTLPDEPWIDERLTSIAAAQLSFIVAVTGVRSLGKGVAYRLAATELHSLHVVLTHTFAEELTPQDRQRFQPHVVVQNKVTPAAARDLLTTLEGQFAPWSVQAEGLDLWHYHGGPWQHARTFPFASASSTRAR